MKFLKLFAVVIAVFLTHSVMASFTTSNKDDSKNKYSLKHLSKLSNNYSFFQLRYKSAQIANNYFYTRDASGLSMSAPTDIYLFSQKATTTFVYPYKFTPKIPKFTTPARPQR